MSDPVDAIMGGGSLISSLFGSDAASDAADDQVQASREANQLQKYYYDTSRSDLAPWRDTGSAATNYLARILQIPGYYKPDMKKPVREDYKIEPTATGSSGTVTTLNIPSIPSDWPYRNQIYSGEDLQNLLFNRDGGMATPAATQPQYDEAAYKAAMEEYRRTRPVDLTSMLESTPGYQFRMAQGNEAIQRSAAAKGNLLSPAAMKELDTFSQGLASDEYSNHLNRLFSISGLGENAAAQSGNQAIQTGQTMGQNLLYAGNAAAAGKINSANAITGGMNSMANNFLMWKILNK